MHTEPGPCCPPPAHPEPAQIRAGLSSLPRQTTSFPTSRRAMLQAVGAQPALAAWTADSPHDLGVMLLEAWAYVLDITGFYDRMVAERSYLGTASDDAIAAELVALTGYHPRPALVAQVRLALEARGRDQVSVPAGTGFRSQPFGTEPAQVFELLAPATVWPQRNRLPLAPHPADRFDGTLRFVPTEGPAAQAVVVVRSGTLAHAARISASQVAPAADGARYRVLQLDPPLPAGFTGLPLSSLQVAMLPLTAYPSPLLSSGAWTNGSVILDALYPVLRRGQVAAVEVDGVLHAVTLDSVDTHAHSQSVGSGGATATIPLSQIGFASLGTVPANAVLRCHLMPKPAGQPTGPAETRLSIAMIRANGRLDLPALALDEAPASGPAVALGQRPEGLDLPGTLQALPVPRHVPDTSADATALLETPVVLLGNLVTAVRGDTVASELLGSGDAQQANQRFRLRKKPLAWVADASTARGWSPQITLWVDGIAWTWVDGFYGRSPAERVYTVEMAPDGTATVVGGDGQRGARFPSGVNNLVVSYRQGAGAAKPPPGSIQQFAHAAPGLARVLQPLPAWGGADAERASDMRELAPASALTLGRAVSLADFEALVRGASGVLNAAVAYEWDAGRQTAVVHAWLIADSGDPSATLAASLAARAAPGLAVRVQLAERVDLPVFDVSIVPAAGHAADAVRAAVRSALFDAVTGLLSPRRVPVAAPLFRSVLLAAIHAVPGVASVAAVSLASGPMPKALAPGAGCWFDFLAHGQVL
jgi:hypothetical protein